MCPKCGTPSDQERLQRDFRNRTMTNDPIDLDGRRTAADRHDSEMRRQYANGSPPLVRLAQPHLQSLEDQMLAEPARTWIEVMEKWRFLLDRYSSTPDAGDERIQELIKCAIRDLERLRKREERK